ncbi:MAG: D-alanyl-lipoteichoic acid biosynthesis protein DltB [Collinsella sp.]
MGFYTSPSFFMALAAAVVPAAVLGFMERRIKYYGFAASCVMVGLLFAGSPARRRRVRGVSRGGVRVHARATLASWKSGRKSMAVYRASLVATIAPLVIYKVGAVFDANLLGFIGISYLTFKAVQSAHRNPRWSHRRPRRRRLPVLPDVFRDVHLGADRSVASVPRRRRQAAFPVRVRRPLQSGHLVPARRSRVATGAGNDYADGSSTLPPPRSFVGVLGGDLDSWPGACAPSPARMSTPLYLLRLCRYSLMAVGASYCFRHRHAPEFPRPVCGAGHRRDFVEPLATSRCPRGCATSSFTEVRAHGLQAKAFSSRLHTAVRGLPGRHAAHGRVAWADRRLPCAYGLYHGVLLALTEVYQKRSAFHKRNKRKRWYRALPWFVTMQLVVIGFALFSGQLTHIIERIING